MNDYLQSLIDELTKSSTNVDFFGFAVSILIALLGSLIVMFMYLYLYEKKDSGSGVYKSFVVIGPSVTAMFLGIQFSLPLSLGLLGALSFIRFRTPIKDPEEVSYLLLLVAVSIACATYNFALAGLTLLIVFLALLFTKKILTGRIFNLQQGHVLISMSDKSVIEHEVTGVLNSLLKNANLKNITKSDEVVNFHYSFSNKQTVPYDKLMASLDTISKVHNCNIVLEEGIV